MDKLKLELQIEAFAWNDEAQPSTLVSLGQILVTFSLTELGELFKRSRMHQDVYIDKSEEFDQMLRNVLTKKIIEWDELQSLFTDIANTEKFRDAFTKISKEEPWPYRKEFLVDYLLRQESEREVEFGFDDIQLTLVSGDARTRIEISK